MQVLVILVGVAAAVGCGSAADVPGDGPGGDAVGTMKRVFVTSADFTGDLAPTQLDDGAMFADQQCQTAAVGGGMAGTWHAWIAGFGDDGFQPRTAPERVTGDGPWHLTGTNELVFLNRAALANTPRVPINRNEYGVLVPGGAVWTATDVGGDVLSFNCEKWTTGNSAHDGMVGELSSAGSQWTYTGALYGCELRARLYCFQM